MKNHVNHRFLMIALTFVCGFSSVYAQEKNESAILQPGRVWNFSATLHDYADGEPRVMQADYSAAIGETVVAGGRECRTLHREFLDVGLKEYQSLLGSDLILNEEDNILSLYNNNRSEERFLPVLDFTLQKGDEMAWFVADCGNEAMGHSKVTADEVILVKGRTYRRLTLTDGAWNCYWVEGIGPSEVYAYQTTFPRATCSTYLANERLEAVYQDGELIFEHADFATTNVVPDEKTPNDDQNHLQQTSHSNLPSTIFDLQGRRMQAVPERGVFIKDGKVMVK